MKKSEKLIEKARKRKDKLSRDYDVPKSCVVWVGNNKYIVVKDGKEIWVWLIWKKKEESNIKMLNPIRVKKNIWL